MNRFEGSVPGAGFSTMPVMRLQAAVLAVQRDDAVLVGLAGQGRLDHDDVAALLLVGGSTACGEGRRLRHHQHVGQHDREGLVADHVAGAPHRRGPGPAAPSGG